MMMAGIVIEVIERKFWLDVIFVYEPDPNVLSKWCIMVPKRFEVNFGDDIVYNECETILVLWHPAKNNSYEGSAKVKHLPLIELGNGGTVLEDGKVIGKL